MAILIEDDWLSFWPLNWPLTLIDYIRGKPKLERLKIAGAFIAAELDQELKRIHYNAWPPALFTEDQFEEMLGEILESMEATHNRAYEKAAEWIQDAVPDVRKILQKHGVVSTLTKNDLI